MKFRLKVRKHLVNFTLLKGRRLCGQIVKEQERVPIRYAVCSYIHYRGPPVPEICQALCVQRSPLPRVNPSSLLPSRVRW